MRDGDAAVLRLYRNLASGCKTAATIVTASELPSALVLSYGKSASSTHLYFQ